jgi:hypothetical protein
MAEIRADGMDLVVALTPLERVAALHGPLRLRRSSVRRARVCDDPWEELRGMRVPGTGLPGLLLLGTMRGPFGKDFCAIYDRRPALVLELCAGERYRRVLVTVADPGRILAELTRAA